MRINHILRSRAQPLLGDRGLGPLGDMGLMMVACFLRPVAMVKGRSFGVWTSVPRVIWRIFSDGLYGGFGGEYGMSRTLLLRPQSGLLVSITFTSGFTITRGVGGATTVASPIQSGAPSPSPPSRDVPLESTCASHRTLAH